MLVLAREEAGYTQEELAALLGITQGSLSKLECGLMCMSDEVMVKLVQVLNKPSGFFRYEGEIEAPTFVQFRKKESIPPSLKKQVWAKITLETIRVKQLLSAMDLQTGELPFFDPDECNDGVVEVAQRIRRMWKLPPGPVKNLIRLAENAGVIVIRFDFGTRKVDGCSGFVGAGSKATPVIFINDGLSAARQKLTVAHELGHLVMHRYPSDENEDQAFLFASELLTPKEDILPMLLPLSFEKLVRLKLHWGVSMQALIKRAEGLAIISPSGARYYWAKMAQSGYKQCEPYDTEIPSESPSLVAEIVDTYFNQLNYTKDELADLILMKSEHVDTVYRSVQFRVVK